MRLIDADALTQSWDVLSNGKAFDFYDIDEIANAPTIDAETVRHGHWIECPLRKYPKEHIDVCSVCNSKALAKYNYCPNCGAKMDEVSE